MESKTNLFSPSRTVSQMGQLYMGTIPALAAAPHVAQQMAWLQGFVQYATGLVSQSSMQITHSVRHIGSFSIRSGVAAEEAAVFVL